MSYLFFFVYTALFCWLLTKIKFVTTSGIEKRFIIILFLIRIAAGVINGYINLYYYPDSDSLAFQQQGISECHLLLHDPKEFLFNLFKYSHNFSGFLETTNSFWNLLRSKLVVKLLAVFNIFSFGNFFINTIFYNFLVFFGSISFYKIFINIFPDKKKLLLISLFLLPSLIYFTSEIHKDGLIFLGLSICSYNLFSILKNGSSLKKILYLAGGFAIIFLLRNFVLITMLPAIAAWIIAEKNKRFILPSFLAVYFIFFILFFNSGLVHPKLNLPKYVSERQIAFILLSKGSGSEININPLYPEFRSFLNNTPQALNHVLMRPYLTEKFNILYIILAAEIFIYEVIFLLFIFFKRDKKPVDPFIYFCIFFSLSMLLVTGFTIPVIGAIVRYRSIYFPLLLIPIICNINWRRAISTFTLNK